MDALAQYGVAVTASPRGRLEVIITVPATSLEQATTTAYAVVKAAIRPEVHVVSGEFMATREFDIRAGMEPMPSLIGTADAAEILGVSQKRVTQLVSEGRLSATRAGRSLALSRSEVEAFAQRDRPAGRPRRSEIEIRRI